MSFDYCIKYIRLSKDEVYSESNSIPNQRILINNYVKNNKNLSKLNHLELVDNGYTGMNFNRPAMKRLLELAKQREVKCIIVKDLSRFGRNFIEIGDYIERIFPFLDIRFISILENFDSNDFKNDLPGLEFVFKNLFNEYTSVEMSNKIRQSLYLKRTTGEHIGASFSYGFCKNECSGNKLFIDEQAAIVVKRIFKMTLDGISRSEIARILNLEGVLSPKDYKRYKKCQQQGIPFEKKYIWLPYQITNFLRNEEYIGTGFSGKYYRPIIGKSSVKSIDKANWHRTLNAHEAIISPEDFEKVQEKFIKSKKINFSKGDSIFSGIVTCGYCNHSLKVRKLSHTKGYYCGYYRLGAGFGCQPKTYKEEDLLKIIYLVIKHQIQLIVNLQLCFEEIKKEYILMKDNLDKELEYIKLEEELLNKKVKNLYESYKYGKIPIESYKKSKEQCSMELQNIIQQKKKTKVQKENILNIINQDISFINDFIKYKDKEIITKELLDNLIEKIYIYDTDNIKIKFKFENECQNLLSICKK